MLTAPTRWLLLEAGRRSIDVWLRAGQLSESGLKSDAHSAYNRMADEAPWPGEQANRAVLAFILLPWAALYSAMREHGRTEQEAVDSVIRAALAGAALERITTGLLLRTAHQRKVATTVRPGAAIWSSGSPPDRARARPAAASTAPTPVRVRPELRDDPLRARAPQAAAVDLLA